jgi:two-component system, NarL family, nitrate/nitrite response regulator NarL
MTRVLLVVSTRLYRDGLATLLNARDEFSVVGAESTGREAIERLDETKPDAALVDVGIPDFNETVMKLAQRARRLPIVAIGISDSDADVLACAELGIAGYVTRASSIDELAAAVQGAADGELICSPRMAGVLLRRVGELAAGNHRSDSVALLTRREREVAALMCEGLANKEIAARLQIEVATVKNHVHNVLDKLRINRRAEVARLLGHPSNRPLGT